MKGASSRRGKSAETGVEPADESHAGYDGEGEGNDAKGERASEVGLGDADEDEGWDEEVDVEFDQRFEIQLEFAIKQPPGTNHEEDGQADVSEEGKHAMGTGWGLRNKGGVAFDSP